MVRLVQIKNFKSVVDVSLELGNFNVLIGENGCGKSNVLEAIAFGAAASADKIDYEFLGSRGVRVTNPEFMYSAFRKDKGKKSIVVSFEADERRYLFDLINDSHNPKRWINRNKETVNKEIGRLLNVVYLEKNEEARQKALSTIEGADNLKLISELLNPYRDEPDFKKFFSGIVESLENIFLNNEISNFIIYSPEQSSLRKFEETSQIYPLGIRGEGLFQYLKELSLNKREHRVLKAIKENLMLLDWYESFDLPDNLMKNDFTLSIKDRYLHPSLQFFDQRSANEGFLFLLFYSTLFLSKTTPSFFAIDNIDTSFNPKLCMHLTKNLIALAKKNKKQVIVTTQNPAILDGLNLEDENQRLFVVRRNSDGHTKVKRVEYNPKRTMKLSEIWTSGFIGGLPENF